MQSPKINGLLLLTNLGLVGAILFLVTSWPDPSARPPQPETVSAIPRPPDPQLEPVLVTVTNQVEWAQLESEDYPTYISRLRSIGCPEQTIRDIVIADLEKLLAPKIHAIYGRRPVVRYWDSEEEELANNYDHREWLRQERELDREKRKIIQELVGVDVVRERLKQRGYQDYYERRLAFLPEEKRGSLRMLIDKYDEREQELREQAIDQEGMAAVDDASLRELARQRQAELAQILTPDEQKQFELWLSSSANAVRYSMYGMDATEQEFLTVYELQKDFDSKWASVDLNAAADTTLLQWQRDRESMDEQVRRTFGDERFREYKRGQDADFHHLNAAVSRYHLPREKAAEAYEIKLNVRQMSAAVRADSALGEPVKQEALQQIAKETERTMGQVLGNAAYRFFRQRSQTDWLAE